MFGRRLMGRGGETRIAASAASALRRHASLAVFREIEQLLAGLFVEDDRAHGHLNRDRFAFVAGPVAAFAVPPALRRIFRD